MLPKSPIALAWVMAGIFAVVGICLIAVSAFAGYQFLGLGFIALLTGAGWAIKAVRLRTQRSRLEEA